MSNDLGKDFAAFQKKVEQALTKLPVLAANEARNFFLDSWKRKAWRDTTTEPWKPRAKETRKSKGKGILIGTGRLRSSIRVVRADWNSIVVGTDVPYASVHNDGFNGTYTRTASRHAKIKGSYKRLGDEKSKSRKMSIRGVTHQEHQNIPRRRFMGDSAYLNKKIDKLFLDELTKIK